MIMKKILMRSFLFLALNLQPMLAQSLPVEKPTDLGFDETRLKTADAVIQQAIHNK